MAILPIIEIPDPRLRTISTPVETVDADLQVLIDDMFETMYDAPGIGLAAIQVGVPQRVLVIDLQEEEDEEGKPVRHPRVFVNLGHGSTGWTMAAGSGRAVADVVLRREPEIDLEGLTLARYG